MALGGKSKTGFMGIKAKYEKRFSECGKFKHCNKCKEDRKVDEYYDTMSHCKFCQKKIAKKAYDKRTKSLW